MKFSAAVSAAVLGFASMASAVTVKYDTGYDDAGRSMNVVACSDGPNGLAARYPTQGSIPGFPNIGSYSGIAGWNSPQCGTCWNLSFNGRTIKMMAIDHAGDGFVLSKQAMDALTGGQAQWYGSIDAQVSATSC